MNFVNTNQGDRVTIRVHRDKALFGLVAALFYFSLSVPLSIPPLVTKHWFGTLVMHQTQTACIFSEEVSVISHVFHSP